MLNVYIKLVSILLALIGIGFMGTLIFQYRSIKAKDMMGAALYYRVQFLLTLATHLLAMVLLTNYYGFSKESLMLMLGEVGLLLIANFLIEWFMIPSILPLWSISMYLMVIGFIMMARLDMTLGTKQFYLASAGLGIALIIAILYPYMRFIKYLGLPAVIIAIGLLFMTNSTINGATNWLEIGGFSFQPSEVVKILYGLFIASMFTLFARFGFKTVIVTGGFTATLLFIQVFQKDLGSALIYYVLFILMCYVFTTNRHYIIGGGLLTLLAGYLAWFEFSHVRVRIESWINPWADIDNKGYQITQSLFAIGNGGMTGTGLTQGMPEKIPVVNTDFIYSAIAEEMGMIVAITIIFLVVMFMMFVIQMLEKVTEEFDFLFGTTLVIVYAFQSFLIIGGVSRAVPLTGVTLPFISYGGSSMIVTFITLGILQGIAVKNFKKKKNMNDEIGGEPSDV